MTARYRLPEVLGLAECVFHSAGHDEGAWIVELTNVAPGMRIELPASMLVKVKPPLPPEPPSGSVVRCDEGYIHISSGASWTNHESGEYATWDAVCRHGAPVLLVPAPEPVALPWEMRTGHRRRLHRRRGSRQTRCRASGPRQGRREHGCTEIWLTSKARRQLIAALTAADAEAQS